MRKLTILAALLLLAPAISQAKSLDELLVEKGVITKTDAKDASSSGGAAKVYWNDGSRLDFPDVGFNTQINTDIAVGYAFNDNDGTPNTSSFDVNRARIVVQGNALHKEFSYVLRADMTGPAGSSKGPSLLDAAIAWHGCDWFTLQMGQFKTAISRQFNSDEHLLQFTSQSRVSQYFNLGRQQGASGMTDWNNGQFTLEAGIFNGSSDGEGINASGVDTKHTGEVSARWNVMGKQNAWEESDLNWTDNPALALGVAYAYSDFSRTDYAGKGNRNSFNFDAEFKYSGWSANAEFFVDRQKADVADSSETPTGFYAQLGYFVDPKKLEIAARYGLIDCKNGKAATQNGLCGAGIDKLNEVDVAVNYYFWKNNLKAQAEFQHLNNRVTGDGDDINDNRWLIQLSSYL